MQLPEDGRKRIVINNVEPEIDGGRFAIKRTIGQLVRVSCVAFADGHDLTSCRIIYRSPVQEWTPVPMSFMGNDRWEGQFRVSTNGCYFYTVEGWVDHFRTWQSDLSKRVAAKQDIAVDLMIGAELIAECARRANNPDSDRTAGAG